MEHNIIKYIVYDNCHRPENNIYCFIIATCGNAFKYKTFINICIASEKAHKKEGEREHNPPKF